MKPEVSVIVPTYNSGSYLIRCINSLLRQYTSRSYEIIIVDDGSTDDSVKRIKSTNSRIRIVHQQHLGAGPARHRGVQEALGDYIIFQDADDIALPNKISVLIDALERYPGAIASCALTLREDDVKDLPLSISEFKAELIQDPIGVMLSRYWPIASAMNLATYRIFALQCGLSDNYFKAANDYAFQIRLARLGPFVRVYTVTTVYSSDVSVITKTQGLPVQIAYSLLAAIETYEALPEREKYKCIFTERLETDLAFVFPFLIQKKNWGLLTLLLKSAYRYVNFFKLFRKIWWTVDRHKDELNLPILIGKLIDFFRKVRAISKRNCSFFNIRT